ncbi:MAG: peroxiredoxin [Glaciimonas sp.]|nr:peroxiredoxin [Glaciimonas sp.]
MKKLITRLVICTSIAALTPALALAALKVGTKAPDFTTQASLGGKVFNYKLTTELKKGPVILYFYPAAFTKGCTIEAHDFAEATDKYKALGATVVGVSNNNIETLNEFSVSACRSKFAVAADTTKSIMQSYDAVLAEKPEYANRTSYVIAPDSTIIYEYTSMEPGLHVKNTMQALQDWKNKQPK